MVDAAIIHALRQIAQRVESQGIRWAVIGSTNLSLQGVDVQPRDLDIVVRLEDLDVARRAFLAENPSDVRIITHAAGEPTHEFGLTLAGVPVQIIAEQSGGPYATKLLARRTTVIRIADIEVLGLALDAEAEAYEETGRPEKAKRIREFLNKQ